jgi:hypothetical protein
MAWERIEGLDAVAMTHRALGTRRLLDDAEQAPERPARTPQGRKSYTRGHALEMSR